jgi:hypothetical protein
MPIIITKLGKGQEIDIICKAYKVGLQPIAWSSQAP